MGDFTLGCLLGQYDKAQSFDVASVAIGNNINSWDIPVGSAAFLSQDISVHSSGQGVRYRVGSRGSANTVLSYIYGRDDDAYARWFPNISTHAMRVDFWANLISNSGAIYQDFSDAAGEQNLRIPQTNNSEVAHHRQTVTSVVSESSRPRLRFLRNAALTTSLDFRIDDVLTQIDPITFHPEYSFAAQARVVQSQHRTRAGLLHTYLWGKYLAYAVPLRFLPDSHAALINWWWENQFNLAFTLDTSDSESIHVVRITNDRQPIGRRMAPYHDLWQGNLQLESIDEGTLVF